MGADPRVRKVRVYFVDESGAMLLADSNGQIVEDLQPMTTMGLTCIAEQDGKREENFYNVAARDDISYYSPDRIDRMVRECVKNTMVLFDATPAPAGEMPVVLAAGSSGILLHEAIGHGMEADFNRKNVSIYSDKIGKPVAKPFVNIVDEGTQEHARGAINVDDEGTVAGKTMLVQDGILTTYLHDTISAKHYGVAPTGNGRRESYQHSPMPRMRSTYMLPGPAQEGRDHRLGEEGHLLHPLHERPGADRRRRLHLLRQERLPDRGRQAHAARSRTSTSSATGRRSSSSWTWSPTTSRSTRAAGPAARTASRSPSPRACRPSASPRSPSAAPRARARRRP